MYILFIYLDSSSIIISHFYLIRISDFTAVELFDALEKSQGDSVEFLGHERRRVAKLCELNCLTRDLDDGYFGSLLVTSGVGCVQFKSRILSLTWSVFKQIPGAIEQQRIAADKSRAAAQAAEADRKAQLKAAEEASEEAAEARRKAAEEGTLTQWNAAVAKSEIASALWKAVVEAGEARCAGRQV
jgi:hypothetical protein